MCTTHDRIAEVCDRDAGRAGKWDGFNLYPCMPYAHKYANAVTELGYFDALRKFLPEGRPCRYLAARRKALATQDMSAIIGLLVDAEMKMFHGPARRRSSSCRTSSPTW